MIVLKAEFYRYGAPIAEYGGGIELTSKERYWRIFKNQEIDRPALKLWGASQDPFLLHKAYKPVRDLALEISDLFCHYVAPFNIFLGRRQEEIVSYCEEPVDDTEWINLHVTWHTPKGDLCALERHSKLGNPPYVLENLIKTPEDIERVLSIPYTPFSFDASDYYTVLNEIGDRGIVVFHIDHAGYALHRLMGSETLALMSIDHRDALHGLLKVFQARIREHVHSALKAGIPGPYAWVGPEVLIPPLLSPKDFEDFVFAYDKPICDDIHNGGSYTWVHCHGKVAKFLDRFINMGVDVLNPLEPNNNVNGDIDLYSVAQKYGCRIGLEGNNVGIFY